MRGGWVKRGWRTVKVDGQAKTSRSKLQPNIVAAMRDGFRHKAETAQLDVDIYAIGMSTTRPAEVRIEQGVTAWTVGRTRCGLFDRY